MLRSHCIHGLSAWGSKADSAHSVRRAGRTGTANPVPRWEGMGFPRMEPPHAGVSWERPVPSVPRSALPTFRSGD